MPNWWCLSPLPHFALFMEYFNPYISLYSSSLHCLVCGSVKIMICCSAGLQLPYIQVFPDDSLFNCERRKTQTFWMTELKRKYHKPWRFASDSWDFEYSNSNKQTHLYPLEIQISVRKQKIRRTWKATNIFKFLHKVFKMWLLKPSLERHIKLHVEKAHINNNKMF